MRAVITVTGKDKVGIIAMASAECAKFGVKQAPTLVVVANGSVEKYTGVSDIKKYLGK